MTVAGTLQQIQQNQQTLTTTAQQQPSNPPLVNKQYNSPLPLYSQENVQEAMRMQTSPSHTPTINPAAAAAAEAATDSATPSLLSPPSAVLAAALAESKPADHHHQPTTDRFKIPLYETNAISGRKKIAQTASFNKLMMDVLGE